MKFIISISIIFSIGSITPGVANELLLKPRANSSIDIEIAQLIKAIHGIKKQYDSNADLLYTELSLINKGLRQAANPKEQLIWLLKKDEIKDQIALLRINEQTDISKIRYIKGLQIIKIL